MTSQRRSKWIFLTPVALIGVICTFLLMHDLENVGQHLSRSPIGKLLRFDGRIRYKPKGAFAAREIQVNQSLFKGDLIIAGTGSRATIEMLDGRHLDLQPGSSVVLDSVTSLDSPSVKGSVLVSTEKGEEKYLTDLKISSGEIEKNLTQLISPEELTEFFFSDESNPNVAFTWRSAANENQKSVKWLQLSKNFLFEEDVLEYPVSGDSTTLNVQISEGKFLWRLVDAEHRPISRSREFKGVKVRSLAGVLPTGQTVAWDDTVEFQWSAPADMPLNLGSHWLEISDVPSFQNIIQKKLIPAYSQHVVISGLSERKYYWRLTSQFSKLIISSPVKEFVVELGKQLVVDSRLPLQNAIAEMPGSILFSWQTNASNVDYHFELQSQEMVPIKEIRTRALSHPINDLPAGSYRWRVSATLKKFQAESEWKNLTVLRAGGLALKLPKPGAKVVAASQDSPVYFEWDSQLQERQEYLFELARDPEFRMVVARKKLKEFRMNSSDFKLENDAVYFWRVSVVSAGGIGQKLSSVGQFQYSIYQGLSSPQELLPQSDTVLNPLKSKTPCQLSWSSVPGASKYEVEIFEDLGETRSLASADGSAAKPAMRIQVKENTYQIKSLREGNYVWDVRAVDKNERLGARSVAQKFKFTLGAPLNAPKSKSPEVQ